MRCLSGKLTYANVMATVAVFIALGGASYAAVKLPRNSVGTGQIKKGAVSGAKIRNGAVTMSRLANGAVGANQLLSGAVGAPQMADGAVGTAEITDGAVTGAKLAGPSITREKIFPGAVHGEALAAVVSNSATYDLPSGGLGLQSTVRCPEGSVPISWGIEGNPEVGVSVAVREPDGWKVGLYNRGAEETLIPVTVYCLS